MIPFHRPDITDLETQRVTEALQSGWLTTGPRCAEFEKKFAEAVGADHAVAVNSCTAALGLALEAMGIGPGDEVIVPTFTFAATAGVVERLGAKPVFVDSEMRTHNMRMDGFDMAATKHPGAKAVIPVHFAGHPCDMKDVGIIAKQNRLRVVDDAAHAFPARYMGRMIGDHGDATAFSFYATKTLTTCEGGMVTTRSASVAEQVRRLSRHGIRRGPSPWLYDVDEPGRKCNMSDVQAALGLAQLERSGELHAKRREIATAYRKAISWFDQYELLDVDSYNDHAWHLFVVRLTRGAWKADRVQVIAELERMGVQCSVHFKPLHIHPYYKNKYGYKPSDLPYSVDIWERSISLPFYSSMTEEEVATVLEALKDAAERLGR